MMYATSTVPVFLAGRMSYHWLRHNYRELMNLCNNVDAGFIIFDDERQDANDPMIYTYNGNKDSYVQDFVE